VSISSAVEIPVQVEAEPEISGPRVRPISGPCSVALCPHCDLFRCYAKTWFLRTLEMSQPTSRDSAISVSSSNAMVPRLRVNPGRVSTFVGCLNPPGSAPPKCFRNEKAIDGMLRRSRKRKVSLVVLHRDQAGTRYQTITFLKQEGECEFWIIRSESDSRVLSRDGLTAYLLGKDSLETP
jgi:hypothetical protein